MQLDSSTRRQVLIRKQSFLSLSEASPQSVQKAGADYKVEGKAGGKLLRQYEFTIHIFH